MTTPSIWAPAEALGMTYSASSALADSRVSRGDSVLTAPVGGHRRRVSVAVQDLTPEDIEALVPALADPTAWVQRIENLKAHTESLMAVLDAQP